MDDSPAEEPSPTHESLTPEELGRLLPQYGRIKLLGKGGMGTIYGGVHKKLKRRVAIKVLHDRGNVADNTYERFEHEAEALAALDHPNIIRVYDYGEVKGLHYIVMEYVDGVNLREAVRSVPEGRVKPEQAICVVAKVCAGLAAAHAKGMVHRDVKPENVMLSRDGKVKLIDFGIAKSLNHDSTQITQTGWVRGTQLYAAPEQFEAPDQVDHRADIYATGVMLYEMLTGQLPLGNFEPPSAIVDVSSELDAIVSKALQRQKEQRFATATEMDTAVRHVTETIKTIIHCIFCKREIKVERTWEGKTINCPHCGQVQSVTTKEPAPPGLPFPERRKVKRPRRIVVTPRFLMTAAMLALSVVLIIRNQDGIESVFKLPDGSKGQIDEDGNLTVELPEPNAAVTPAPKRKLTEGVDKDPDITDSPGDREQIGNVPHKEKRAEQPLLSTAFIADQSTWEENVQNVDTFLTTAENLRLATEIEFLPQRNQSLGSELTFQSNTTKLQRSFRLRSIHVPTTSGGGLVFVDQESGLSKDRVISIGDGDGYGTNAPNREQYENDDFEIRILDGPPLTAFCFFLYGNSSSVNESLSIYAGDKLLATYSDIPSHTAGEKSQFVGITSNSPFDRIVFDEDYLGGNDDDIGVHDFYFGSFVPKAGLVGPAINQSDANAIEEPSARYQWKESEGGNDHYYEVVHKPATWFEAYKAAQEMGGVLATIQSKEENEFFKMVDDPQLWIAMKSASLGPWLGGRQTRHDSEPSGGWSWVTGEAFPTYTNWREGEPRDSLDFDEFGGGEDHLHFFSWPEGTRQATWNDLDGRLVLNGYVVEYSSEELIEANSAEVPGTTESTALDVPVPSLEKRASPNKSHPNRKSFYIGRKADAAIQAGLNWLLESQNRDGSWSLQVSDKTLQVPSDLEIGATSLALLALQRAGYDGVGSHKFNPAVKRGVFALLKKLDAPDPDKPPATRVYERVLADLAIIELVNRVDDFPQWVQDRLADEGQETHLADVAQKSLARVLQSQNMEGTSGPPVDVNFGGWGYLDGSRSDASITGWHVQVLVAAQRSGLKVDRETTDAACAYLRSLWRANGPLKRYIYCSEVEHEYLKPNGFRYALGSHASALASLRALQVEPDEVAVQSVLAVKDQSFANAYFGYYGTKAFWGTRYWDKWWPQLERCIVDGQDSDGSWSPLAFVEEGGAIDSQCFAERFGRHCLTCFRLLTLEIPRESESSKSGRHRDN